MRLRAVLRCRVAVLGPCFFPTQSARRRRAKVRHQQGERQPTLSPKDKTVVTDGGPTDRVLLRRIPSPPSDHHPEARILSQAPRALLSLTAGYLGPVRPSARRRHRHTAHVADDKVKGIYNFPAQVCRNENRIDACRLALSEYRKGGEAQSLEGTVSPALRLRSTRARYSSLIPLK